MARLQSSFRIANPARRAGMLAVALLVAPAGAGATQDYKARDVGGWTVAASRDAKGCFLTRAFDRAGGTTLLFGLDVGGANRLTLLNANWSIEPRERLKLDFRLSGAAYRSHFAVGLAAQDKQGFVTSFDAKFPMHLATSARLAVARGAVPVERLDLTGSGAAVAELRRCVAAQHAVASPAGGGVRADRIPRDPFARDAKRRMRDR